MSKTVAVEAWLGTLPLANASKAKIRNVNVRRFLLTRCGTNGSIETRSHSVRQSAKREQTCPDVLTALEIGALLVELPDPCRTAVPRAACTGLRVSRIDGFEVDGISTSMLDRSDWPGRLWIR